MQDTIVKLAEIELLISELLSADCNTDSIKELEKKSGVNLLSGLSSLEIGISQMISEVLSIQEDYKSYT